jgi:hypothetical protein
MANEIISPANPRRTEKRNTTFVPISIKNKVKSFGKTHNNFYKDYINCANNNNNNNNKTQNNRESSNPKNNTNRLNYGFVPVSSLKVHYVDI